jgi:hypothetical protein
MSKQPWLTPLLLGLLAVLVAGVFGVRAGCAACDRAEDRNFRKMVVAKAEADNKCSKAKVVSGDTSTGIYHLNVCGKHIWYKCQRKRCGCENVACKRISSP